jgi:hypothetical protein
MVSLALHFFVRGQCRRIGLPFSVRAPLFVFVLISLFLVGLVLRNSKFLESVRSSSSSSDPCPWNIRSRRRRCIRLPL